MKPIMDMHTHTMASGHGYSTLKENIEAAKEAGLLALGLSEHGPAMPGGPHIFFFSNYRCIPREYGGLRLFCGVEANICGYDGRLDLEEGLLKRMDYVIASMHTLCCKPGTMEENTRASILAMQNPHVTVLGHPDDDRYPLDRERIVRAAKETGTAIEINNSSLNPHAARKGAQENIKELLYWCGRYETPVLLGTDSHICYTIGDFSDTLALIEEADFAKELVLNYDIDTLKKIVKPDRL